MSADLLLQTTAPSQSTPRRRWPWAAPLAIALAGAAVYAGSLNAPLVFDDVSNIVENDAVQHPTADKLYRTGGRRIVAFVTFAANQSVHGLWPAGYRATNVAIHILAAIVLFDLVRMTLLRTSFAELYAAAVVPAAFCAAMLWVVHPLATQAVTCVVQRMESLASLFYLACLWGLARGSQSQPAAPWLMLAALCAWLGLATKETAATLPLAALLYDRIYLAASWRELWRRRWGFYVAVLPAAIVFAATVLPTFRPSPSGPDETATVGVGIVEATPWEYLRTQAGVVLHYARLAVWPAAQCFDYDWPVARGTGQWLPAVLVVGAVLLATALLLWFRPRVGFLPALFFLFLTPSSSVLPIRDLAVEHRMYLPLAVLVVGVVVLGFVVSSRMFASPSLMRLSVALPLLVFMLASVALGSVAVARNRVYLDTTALWSDVIAKAPHNPRGHYNLGLALLEEGQTNAALDRFRGALQLAADDRNQVRAQIAAKYGVVLAQHGDAAAGLPLCEEAARLDPNLSEIQIHLGIARAMAGDDRGAVVAFQRAIELRADRVEAHFNLGQIAERLGDLQLAEHHLAVAQQLDPRLPQIHERLARVRFRLSRASRSETGSS